MPRYQPKGLLHSKRFTTNPRDCGFCGKPLPIPHPTSQRMHDECRHDPARLEAQRQNNRKRERIRDREQRAARAAAPPVMRICKHPLEKNDGPTEKPTTKIRGVVYLVCGVAFEAKPRIDANGVNRGVHADQQYCEKHQTPKAVSHRQVLHRDPRKESERAKAYRKTPRADKLRERQRLRAEEIRRLAKKAKRPADWWDRPLLRRIIGGELLSRDGYMSNEELGQRLDKAGELKCNYAPEWETAFSRPGRAANLLTEIRKWVGRPGKSPRKK